MIQYFYRFHSIKSYYKIEAVILWPVQYILVTYCKEMCFQGEQTQQETGWRREWVPGEILVGWERPHHVCMLRGPTHGERGEEPPGAGVGESLEPYP